jgi:hypothetical protein
MVGRRLKATKLVITAIVLGFTVAAFSGALPWPLGVVSVLAFVPIAVLFSRWDVREVLRRPAVQLDVTERDAPLPGETYVFTSTYARVLAAAFPLALALTAAGVAVAAPKPAWLLVLPIVVLFGFVVSRAARIALELGYDGVTIRNTYRTHVIRWEDVRHAYLGADCLSFVVRGRRLGVEAVATRGKQRDPTLVHQLRRFAEPRGIELEPELLRI